jgi:hypothetical protein
MAIHPLCSFEGNIIEVQITRDQHSLLFRSFQGLHDMFCFIDHANG